MAQWMCFFEKKDMYRADSSRTRIAFFRGLFVFLQSLAVGLLLFSFWLPYDISYNFYSYVLGVSVGISVVYACLRPRLSWEWSQSRPFLPMVLLYLLMWLSVLYSMDKVEAVRRCWYCLSLLLYPVIFVGMGRDFFSVKRCRLWAVVFVASCFVEILCRTGLSVYCFCTVPELEPYRQVGFVAALNEFLGFQNIYLSWAGYKLVMHTTFEAMVLNFAFALVAMSWIRKDSILRRKGLRLGALFFEFLSALTLLSSNSKTGQVIFGCTLLILFFQAFKYKRYRLVIGAGALLCSFLIVLLPYAGKGLTSRMTRSLEVFESFFSKPQEEVVSDGSTLPRIYCWQVAARMIRERPLAGYGMGFYSDFNKKFAEIYGDYGKVYSDSHNQFLNTMLSNGLLGLALFLWLWVCMIRLAWQEKKVLGWIWLLSVFGLCMVDTFFNSLVFLFYLCAGYGLLSLKR